MTRKEYIGKLLENVTITDNPELSDKSNDPYFVEKRKLAEKILSKSGFPEDLIRKSKDSNLPG